MARQSASLDLVCDLTRFQDVSQALGHLLLKAYGIKAHGTSALGSRASNRMLHRLVSRSLKPEALRTSSSCDRAPANWMRRFATLSSLMCNLGFRDVGAMGKAV